MVVNLLLERIESLKEVNYDPNRPLLDQLKSLAYLTIQLSSDPDYLVLSRIVIIESMRSQQEAQRLNDKFSDCEQGLQNWFTQAAKAGALGNIEPKLAATLFYGGLKKQVYWEQVISWKPHPNDEEAERLISQTCEFFARALTQK
jgi:TetR/AcrR family transcriptional regulator of autoinduction and epiphytic fitness